MPLHRLLGRDGVARAAQGAWGALVLWAPSQRRALCLPQASGKSLLTYGGMEVHFWCIPRLANPWGAPAALRPFRGVGRCDRAGGWRRGTPRAQLFPACLLSWSLTATAPGAREGDTAPSLGQPLGKGTWRKNPSARHRFEGIAEFQRFISHRGWGGDKTGQNSHRDIFTTNIIPKSCCAAAWRGHSHEGEDPSVRPPELCSHRSTCRGAGLAPWLLPTTLAAQIGFKAQGDHLPALTPLPPVPRPACRGLGMKTTLRQRSPRLTPPLLLQPTSKQTPIPKRHGNVGVCPERRGRNRRRFDKSIIHTFCPVSPARRSPRSPGLFLC